MGSIEKPAGRPLVDALNTPAALEEARRTRDRLDREAAARHVKPRPSIMSAITRVFRNPAAEERADEVTEARRTYARLLRLVVVDRHELSEKEIAAFQDAMRKAGITAAAARADEMNVRKVMDGRAAQDLQRENVARMNAIQKEQQELFKRAEALQTELANLIGHNAALSSQIGQACVLEAAVKELIGEL